MRAQHASAAADLAASAEREQATLRALLDEERDVHRRTVHGLQAAHAEQLGAMQETVAQARERERERETTFALVSLRNVPSL